MLIISSAKNHCGLGDRFATVIAAGMDGQRDVKMLYAFAMGQVAGGKVAA
jgi:hypothetical protein